MSKNCSACNDLRKSSPEFTQKGVTETVCTSLKNNTGFNPSNDTEDFDDLYDAVDCLVCNMDDELPAYDVCDWKEFMKKLIPNLCDTLKAIVCAIGGIWNFIKDILGKLAKLECRVNSLTKTKTFSVDESNIKWAPGVAKREDDTGWQAIPHISGNAYVGYMTGSIKVTEAWANNHPNSSLNEVGALLYEYRIKLADHNIKRFWNGQMQETANGICIHCHIQVFRPGEKTFGYNDATGTGSTTVPDGWNYIQVRISSYESLGALQPDGYYKFTPAGLLPVLMDVATECD